MSRKNKRTNIRNLLLRETYNMKETHKKYHQEIYFRGMSKTYKEKKTITIILQSERENLVSIRTDIFNHS